MLGAKDSLPSKFFCRLQVYLRRLYCLLCGINHPPYIHKKKEHFNDKQSHIHKHLKSNTVCDQSCDKLCFTIIDCANTEYELKIKEAIHIQW